MTAGVPVLICARCERAVFPDRFLCPGCGYSEWRRRRIHGGVVEDATTLRRASGHGEIAATRLGTVRLDDGPPVVARLEPGAGVGGRVRMRYDGGVPVASPAGRRRPRAQ